MSSPTLLGTKIRTAFQGWMLKNAVRQENVKSVQRWATSELFETLSEHMVAKIMTVACQKASQIKPSRNSEIILDHLLHNGGVLSIHCINTSFEGNKPSLGILGFKWMQMAVDCNAVHDNLKYTMLREGIHNHQLNAFKYGHELSESILIKWPDYFLKLDSNMRDQLWKHIVEKGSDTLLRQLIEITPQDHIQIDHLRYLHKRDHYPTPLSVKTLYALHQKGFTVDLLINLWVTGNEKSNMSPKHLEGCLDRHYTLVKNLQPLQEQLIIEQQRQRLLDEANAASVSDTPKIKPRKM